MSIRFWKEAIKEKNEERTEKPKTQEAFSVEAKIAASKGMRDEQTRGGGGGSGRRQNGSHGNLRTDMANPLSKFIKGKTAQRHHLRTETRQIGTEREN